MLCGFNSCFVYCHICHCFGVETSTQCNNHLVCDTECVNVLNMHVDLYNGLVIKGQAQYDLWCSHCYIIHSQH